MSNSEITILVSGLPKAQPRGRAVRRGRKAGIISGTSANYWKQEIREAALPKRPSEPLSGPLSVSIIFIFPRPLKHYHKDGSLRIDAPEYHTNKPDRDNLDKAVLDTLTGLRFWGDDCQIAAGQITKYYGANRERCGAVIKINKL